MSEDELFLPEHTISMRKALAYCQDLFQERTNSKCVEDASPSFLVVVGKEAGDSAVTIPSQRQKALLHFWKQQDALLANNNETKITTIDVASSSTSPFTLDPIEFRQRFQNGNLPCLIRGLDKTPYFSSVCAKWRRSSPSPENGSYPAIKNGVNRNWFLEHVRRDTKVPVRFQVSTSQAAAGLDGDGRAQECETKEMVLHEWIDLLDEARLGASPSAGFPSHHGDYYLKDWHLQSNLRQSAHLAEPSTKHQTQSPSLGDGALYHVPPYFEHDLLNAFLIKFTQSGDYMFTYWGPKGSKTTLHSDVMNSFSWSFNVAGTKEWKFYPPQLETQLTREIDSSPVPLVLIQREGEAIFVPCGWQHEVRNLEETLSINHNWITTANIDQTWECMRLEMKAIEAELKEWDMDSDCWDARESMLRGCFGLDVTAFFLMLLTRIVELLLAQNASDKPCEGVTGPPKGSEGEGNDWQLQFNLARLKQALAILLGPAQKRTAPGGNTTSGPIGLEERLAAVLGSRKAAIDAIELAKWATAVIDCPSLTDSTSLP